MTHRPCLHLDNRRRLDDARRQNDWVIETQAGADYTAAEWPQHTPLAISCDKKADRATLRIINSFHLLSAGYQRR
jgi:hypothetical protein